MKMLNANWNKMTQEKGEQQQQQKHSSHVFMRCAWIKLHTCKTYKRYYVIYTIYLAIGIRHLRFTLKINDSYCYTHLYIILTCYIIYFLNIILHKHHIPSNRHQRKMLISIVHCSAFVVLRARACTMYVCVCDCGRVKPKRDGHGYMDYVKKKSHCHWYGVICVVMNHFALNAMTSSKMNTHFKCFHVEQKPLTSVEVKVDEHVLVRVNVTP